MAQRIKNIIEKWIHFDQIVYVCDRNIGESVHLINDILECTDENDTEAILFSADLRKHLTQFKTPSSFPPS